MISDLNGSLWSRQFLNVANKRTYFASCACAFKSSGLITRHPFDFNMLVSFRLKNVKQGHKIRLTVLNACWIMHIKCC